jgi:kumamolisin
LKLPMRTRRRRLIVATVVVTAAVPATALFASTASAKPPPQRVSIAQGIDPAALKGATIMGTTASNTQETVSFILRGRNMGALASAVEAGDSPDLPAAGFAARYGQNQGTISALEGYLEDFGIGITHTYADGLDVSTIGTVSEYDSALSVQQRQFRIPAIRARDGSGGIRAQTVHAAAEDPSLPASFGVDVLAVLGLSNYSAFTDDLTHTPGQVRSSARTAVNTGNLTPADFARNYDLSPLYADGMTGAGQTIGIVTLAGFAPATAEHFWKNVLGIRTAPDRITVDDIDGGPGQPNEFAGSTESDLDVEQSGALAPDANIIVYQAQNSDAGYADAFFAAASDNIADTVSTSWGQSETFLQVRVASNIETSAYSAALDEAFLEMAAQDQSMFAAAGDSGAYDASGDIGTTNLSVDSPADSPFVTDAGGTTLGGELSGVITTPAGKNVRVKAKIPAQRAWGWDWLWPYYAAFGLHSESMFAAVFVVGGGGGFSTVEPTPSYQQDVSGTQSFRAVQYLRPTSPEYFGTLTLPISWSFTANPAVRSGSGSGRAVPDLAADADPFTGYLVYDPLAQVPLQGGYGGTSFVAPQLAGSAAVIDQYTGHRVGFWNPWIYAFAATANSPFKPLGTSGTTNDNLYYTGTPGQTYNVGTGLGYPNLAKLAADFAG